MSRLSALFSILWEKLIQLEDEEIDLHLQAVELMKRRKENKEEQQALLRELLNSAH